jgi:hypothetical protein
MENNRFTCQWCHGKFIWSGRGRRPLYCKPAHRQRAFECRKYDPQTVEAMHDQALLTAEALSGAFSGSGVLSRADLRVECYRLQEKIKRLKRELRYVQRRYTYLTERLPS